jgi:hypothetical protein
VPPHIRVDRTAFERHSRPFRKRVLPAIAAIAIVAGSCAPLPPTAVLGPDPSDPSVRVPGVQYRSAVASYRSRRPVEPGPWANQNESAKPNAGGE